MSKKHKHGNFSVRHYSNNKKGKERTGEEKNSILIRKFLRKFKQSGILRELKNKKQPMTRGQKKRQKKWFGKKRQLKNRQLRIKN